MGDAAHPIRRDLPIGIPATLKEAPRRSGYNDERRFDEIVDPKKMTRHGLGWCTPRKGIALIQLYEVQS